RPPGTRTGGRDLPQRSLSPPRHDREDPKQKMRAFDGEVAIAVAPFYSVHMLQRILPVGFIVPCLPTKTDKLPSGGQWLHEIKHDGFRVIARKTGAQVRLYSWPGNDLTYRFPLIVETLAPTSAVIEVRKATLASIVAKAGPGIRFNEHIEGDGETFFRHACKLGLEGVVSKRKNSPYRSGRSPDWLKMKNLHASRRKLVGRPNTRRLARCSGSGE